MVAFSVDPETKDEENLSERVLFLLIFILTPVLHYFPILILFDFSTSTVFTI